MIISRIVAHNILTYKDLDRDLEKLPGLNLILGVVNDRSGSCSNGAGKTNLLEIILWGTFGKTIRYGDSKDGFIRNELVNGKIKKCKEYYAHIYIKDGEQVYRIERSKSGVLLFIDNAEVKGEDISKRSKVKTQKDINNLLGTDFNAFLNTNIFAADKVVAFASAAEKDRNSTVDKILGLEILAKCFKEVKERKKVVQSDIDLKDNTINNLRDIIDDLTSDREDAEEKLEAEQEEVESNVKELEENKLVKDGEIEECDCAILSMNKSLEKSKAEKEEKENKLEATKKKFKDEIKELNKDIRLKESDIRSLQSDSKRFDKLIKSSGDLVGEECPTCGADVTEDSFDDIKEHCEDQKKIFDKRIADIQPSVDKLYKAVEKKEVEADNIDTSEIDSVEETIQDIKEQIAEIKSEKRVAETELKNINKEIKKANEVKPVYEDIINDIDKKIKKHKEEIEKLKEEKDKLVDKQALLQFWEEGYGSAGLKSYIIQNIKPELNRLANEYSEDLTDGSIKIKFDMTTKVRAGVVREKVEIEALNQYGANIYKGNSSGERTRIDIAILKALQKVSTNRRFDQDWFDEVTTHIDDFGGERFIKMLQREINDKHVFSTFVISHLSAMKNNYDSIITCTKTDGISRLSVT